MQSPASFLLTMVLLPLTGCGEAGYEAQMKTAEAPAASHYANYKVPAPGQVISADSDGGGGMAGGMMGMHAATAPEAPAEAAAPTDAGISRKVIYDATLDLAVDAVDPVAAMVGELVASSGGYIAEENMTGSPGSLRSQFWRLRVPVDRFDGLVRSIMALGELVQFNRKSQDVTAEFYDVEARIKNKLVEEETLKKILEERSGQLEEVLKVEVELARVRGEVEQMQGRLRVLQNLSSLATLTLTIRERDRFQPPAPVVADFPTQLARTWQSSLTRLLDLGKALTIFVVGQVVWLPFYAIGLVLMWWGLRRLIAIARTPRPTTSTPPAV
ncbi:DUF4349 domain-containing protein [Planctomyces sp. SH-PL62]|uniref:DUF4349 domain-containing protein n=1 Tax=Planctomyces sp. SH-PL62 TaxID=1636152 RepID=UPI00078DA12A|nr:DUF4349 domain-containing protein [Planctomyces sp. SH-PL62]AMV35943.1 hypothetical protein VT85_00765 [Planctomyces sp. SH-PL62]